MNKSARITLASVIFIIISMFNTSAQTQKPDFAYPQKVSANAEKDLEKAIKAGNSQEIIRSLIDYAIAQSLIDNDNLPATIAKIESICEAEKDPCTKSILYTLLADIYSEIYLSQRWKYDRRETSQQAVSNDYTTWSGNDFTEKIISLCDSALANTEALQATPLKDYKSVITHDNYTLIFYPTLYDFIARHAIDTLDELSTTNDIFSISWLCRYDIYQKLKFTYTSPIAQRILTLYQSLLKFNADRPAAFINCDLARIDFIRSSVYDDHQSSETDQEENTFNLLQALYNRYSDTEYSAEILWKIYTNGDLSEQNRKWLYNAITSHIRNFPAYYNIGCLKNALATLSQPSIELRAQDLVVPNDTFSINITNLNTADFTIDIYRLPESVQPRKSQFRQGKTEKSPTLISSTPFKCDSIVPYENIITFNTALTTPGEYIIVPNFNGNGYKANKTYDIINCTDLVISVQSFNDQTWASVVNPLTGAPVENATIYNYINNKCSKIATTDTAGRAVIKATKGRIFASKGNCTSKFNYYIYDANNNNARYFGSCYTDLAVYHPGDSVKWAAVLYVIEGNSRKPAKDKFFTATIRDANYQIKDTVTLCSDAWGRINGSFKIPAEGLTGNYQIQVEDKAKTTYTYGSFTVSDYKLPTYYVIVTEVLKGTPHSGAVTLKGKAESYSGFPIADAQLTVGLSVSQRYWWRSFSSKSYYTTTASTNSDGTFTIEFPAELLAEAPIPNGLFTAKITAVSTSGESNEISKSFTVGTAYIIEASLDENIDVANPIKLNVKLNDINGVVINDTINYNLTQDDKIIYTGSFTSNNPVVDLRNVASGNYSFTFSIADAEKATPVTIENINLYRPSDKLPPEDTPLWIPQDSYIIENNHASILYGTSKSNSHIEYIVWNSDKIISRGWLTPAPGLHHFEVDIPDGVRNLTITFNTINNYLYICKKVNITIKNSTPEIKLEVESFRDRITPGATETWKFKVTDNTGNGSKSAMILDMYAKALDKIKAAEWHFSPYTANGFTYYCNAPDIGSWWAYFYADISKSGICKSITQPELETYGYHFLEQRYVTLYSANRVTAESSTKVTKYAVVNDYADLETEETNDDLGSAQDETKLPTATRPSTDYRMAETPLAFFEPMLTTDDNGQLSFTFTAPNANTTWCFNAIAYNADLLTDDISFDVISNKPIMVQPNLPRFLRTGDYADIKASVMNNSDTIQSIVTTIEIFDYASGNIIKHDTHSDTIAAGKSAIVTTSVNAPFDSPFIGYRIKSTNGIYTDGEQAIIAILPSSTPVIDTKPFYLGAKEHSYTTELPEMPADAKVTLQFCENPVWYCVTALPGLRATESRSSLSAMAAVFSAAVADGILRNNPDIATALHKWEQSNKTDSTLMSMLERNQDLKNILLNATPWVMDARSDTERMARLALLFDKDEINRTYSRNITLLAELQRGKGGWAWIAENKEASQWCTLNILEMLGHLKQLGYMPNDKRLDTMIENAVKQLDDCNARTFAKYPQQDYCYYVLIRDYFKDIKQSTAARRVTSATVQRLITGWKDENITRKAISALILNNNGYPTTSRQILNSMREYARSSASLGMWWPSLDDMTQWSMGKIGATAIILDAFYAVEPQCAEIDLIRQWLILQKEAKDWGTSVTTSSVIASILKTGSNWSHQSQDSIVKVGDNIVTPNVIEQTTGYFRSDISKMNPSGATLSVYKTSDTPAWGAVYCQYSNEMSRVTPSSCEAVSIEKRLYKQTATSNGMIWTPADSISIGDRIKVELLIKTSRDMDYVTIIDDRAACFEPVEQLPTPIFAEGLFFYRENRDAVTNIFVDRLPKGTYLLSYQMFVNNAGIFSAGVASIQSQYAPSLSAHSSGEIISVK